MKINLSIGVLSLKNLQAKPARTACLVIVVAILAFTIFGGSILVLNLQQGLATVTKRFGADLMIVPEGASERAETLLLRGGTENFYLDASFVDAIAKMSGVASVSPQFFLASLAESSCCDDAIQLIAYDPDTDFVVQPWISEKYNEQIADGQVVVGNRIIIRHNRTILLFDHEYPVAARLSPSASGFDTSIFMTMNTMRQLINRAQELKINLPDNYQKDLVSAILVKTDPMQDSSQIANNIQNCSCGGFFDDRLNRQAGFSAICHCGHTGTKQGTARRLIHT